MKQDELYMFRCLELAALGAGYVAPNPMVGAVLVYEDRVIGEGYHQVYGEAHAEVNCIKSVQPADLHLIPQSTIYVSLEPCAHFGKTPPCADLIIAKQIPKVVVGCRDPFEQVDGKGIEKLRKAGVEIVTNILEERCRSINKRFFTFHTRKRPYIILKWAESKNKKIANADRSRVLISNDYTNRLVHKWRSEEAAIMVGTNTALLDNPTLNIRNWKGKAPIRLVVDLGLRLPATLNIFDNKQPTVILNYIKNEGSGNLIYYQLDKETTLPEAILNACYELHIQSILIEGGSILAQSFINENAWDEARVIENATLIIDNGFDAPKLTNETVVKSEMVETDHITYYKRKEA